VALFKTGKLDLQLARTMYKFSHRLDEDTYGQRMCFNLLTLSVVRYCVVLEDRMQREPKSMFLQDPAEVEVIKQGRSLSLAQKGLVGALLPREAFPLEGKGA
jgi:hypothetical protein